MLELDSAAFLGAITQMRSIIVLAGNNTVNRADQLTDDDQTVVARNLDQLADAITKTGARSAFAAAARFRARFEAKDTIPLYSEVNAAMLDIESRFSDHLSDIKLFVLQPTEAVLMKPVDELLSNPERPVQGFSMAFPSASFEVEEAAKCLALSRHTAAVFHAMRAMECGIRALCRYLDIPDATKPAEKNWGKVLGQIKSKIDERWPSNTRLPKTVGAHMEALYTTLDAIKNPWRNATMHVENIYAPHEALHIVRCVGHFLLELAVYCDEQGLEAGASPAMVTVNERSEAGGARPA